MLDLLKAIFPEQELGERLRAELNLEPETEVVPIFEKGLLGNVYLTLLGPVSGRVEGAFHDQYTGERNLMILNETRKGIAGVFGFIVSYPNLDADVYEVREGKFVKVS